MDINSILSKVDHTLLAVDATFNDVKRICDEAIEYSVASVCIAPGFVKQAKEYVGNKIKICTVVGFPNGYNSTECKVFETSNAVENGADEIDMVINIGKLKNKEFDFVLNEIKSIKEACNGRILKVIIETCLLTEEEKIQMCKIITQAKVNFIKTSTGFSKSGAKLEDIILFKKHLGKNVEIKAAGGILNLEDAEKFIKAGATRLGTSRIIKLIKEKIF